MFTALLAACASAPPRAVELDGGPPSCPPQETSALSDVAPGGSPEPAPQRKNVGGLAVLVFWVSGDTVPVPEAEVTLQRAAKGDVPSSSLTPILLDSAGRGHLRGVPPGAYVLRARRIGYCPSSAQFRVRPGYVDTVPLQLHMP